MKFKYLLYKKEQDEIIDKIMKILNLHNNLDSFITLYEIDNSDIKNQLMNLIPEIRTFFAFGKFTPIINPDNYDRPYLTIIRQITKTKYIMKSTFHRIYKDGNVIGTQKYTFQKRI